MSVRWNKADFDDKPGVRGVVPPTPYSLHSAGNDAEEATPGRHPAPGVVVGTPAAKKKRGSPEHDFQVACCNYLRWKYPDLPFWATPNGGHRHKATAARLKEEGQTPGVPDIQIARPSGLYHGLFVELKVAGNSPTPEQVTMMERLTREGYRCEVAYTPDEFMGIVEDYLAPGQHTPLTLVLEQLYEELLGTAQAVLPGDRNPSPDRRIVTVTGTPAEQITALFARRGVPIH